jgi:lipid-A-disaccharide synthase-like uncharacterized protein
MLLTNFKTAAEIITGTAIKQVFFDRSHIINTERGKSYPYVFWNMNTWKGSVNWANILQKQEEITIRVYVVGYFDRGAASEDDTQENIWDTLRSDFRTYLTVLNTNQYIKILNLNNMPFEYFPFGLVSIDAEIGVAFDIEMALYC